MHDPAARKIIDDFLDAFNALDGDAIRDTLHFPNILISTNGVQITDKASDFVNVYTDLPQTEGWHHTELGDCDAVQMSEDKVHFTLNMTRHHADGAIYSDITGLWIVTRVEGRWGVLVRSMFHT